MKVSVIGVGAFGFSLLHHLDKKNVVDCELWAFDAYEELMTHLKKERTHLFFHKGFKLSDKVIFASSLEEAVKDADIIILALTSDMIRQALRDMKPFLKKKVIVLNVAKALETTTGKPISSIFREETPNVTYAILAGGTIASDLMKNEPLGADIACKKDSALKKLKDLMEAPNLHIYLTSDVKGVEYASSFKNVISILAGIIHGLDMSYGSETYFITRASGEVKNLVTRKLGAKDKTFSMESQCWGNDLWMSSTGGTRNRAFGIEIGKGSSPEKALKKMRDLKYSIEGLNTINALSTLIREPEKYPVLFAMIQIVIQGENPRSIILGLMNKNF